MPISDYGSTTGIQPKNKTGQPTVDKAVTIRLENAAASTGSAGRFTIPFDNIQDAQDLAVYDAQDNLLPYFIVNPGDINGASTSEFIDIVVWNNWVFDSTTQGKIAYGSNSANIDRSDEAGTWNNTGQNCEVALFAQTTNGDDSANNHDFSLTSNISGVSNNILQGSDGWSYPNTVGEEAVAGDGWQGITGADARTMILQTTEISQDRSSLMKWGSGNTSEKYAWRLDNGVPRIENAGGNVVASTSAKTGAGVSNTLGLSFPQGGSLADHTFYHNGQQDTQSSTSDNNMNTAANVAVNIGGQPFGQHQPMDGDIGYAKIFSDEKGAEWHEVEHNQTSEGGFTDFVQSSLATVYTRTLNAGTGLNSNGLRFFEGLRTRNESLALNTVFDALVLKFARLKETVGMDSNGASVADLFRSAGETVGLTVTGVTVAELVRKVSEAISLNEFTSKFQFAGEFLEGRNGVVGYGRIGSAEVGSVFRTEETKPIDTAKALRSVGKILTEAVALSDRSSRAADLFRTTSESIGLNDAVSTVAAFSRSLGETVGVDEAASLVTEYFRVLNEQVSVRSSVRRTASVFKRSVSEGVGLAGRVGRTLLGGAVTSVRIGESIGVKTQATLFNLVARILQERVGVKAQANTVSTLLRSVSESIGLKTVSFVTRVVDLVESFSVDDSVSRVSEFKRSAQTTVGLDSNTSIFKVFREFLTEEIGVETSFERGTTVFKRTLDAGLGLKANFVQWLNSFTGSISTSEKDDTENVIYQEDDNYNRTNREVHE